MTAPLDGPGPEDGMSAADKAYAAEVREIAEQNAGWEVTHDLWGRWRARNGDEDTGHVATSALLRAMIGWPRPRRPSL